MLCVLCVLVLSAWSGGSPGPREKEFFPETPGTTRISMMAGGSGPIYPTHTCYLLFQEKGTWSLVPGVWIKILVAIKTDAGKFQKNYSRKSLTNKNSYSMGRPWKFLNKKK